MIELIKKISLPELEQMIRAVPLKKTAQDSTPIHVYKNAHIIFKKFKAEEVNPPTFYLIKRNLDFQRQLRQYMLKIYHIDTLNLDSALEIRNKTNDETWLLTPPIIEITPRLIQFVPQEEGEITYKTQIKLHIPLICDGAHRVAIAKESNIEFTAISISNVNEKYLFYAHPNHWDRVKIVDEIPKTKVEKKLYRFEDCYALYRDFDTLGCGKPRYTGK